MESLWGQFPLLNCLTKIYNMTVKCLCMIENTRNYLMNSRNYLNFYSVTILTSEPLEIMMSYWISLVFQIKKTIYFVNWLFPDVPSPGHLPSHEGLFSYLGFFPRPPYAQDLFSSLNKNFLRRWTTTAWNCFSNSQNQRHCTQKILLFRLCWFVLHQACRIK